MKKIQPSFSRGEISPQIHGRVDSAAYDNGLATARNITVHTYGGVSSRHGTRFVGQLRDFSGTQRLIPFEFKTEDQYILEFGDFYMRVIRNDAHVLDADNVVTAITQAAPGVITSTGHSLFDGDEVFVSGVVGMTELNSVRYIVANATANTFTLQDRITSADIDTTTFTAYSSGGSVNKIYEIATPFAQADLPELTYIQSADVMTFAHKNYYPRELRRTDHDAWTLTQMDINPDISHPTGVTVTAGTTGSRTVYYKVTAVSFDNEEESLPGIATGSTETITNIAQTNPMRVTVSASSAIQSGDEVRILAVVGMTEVNNTRFLAERITSTTFDMYYPEGGAVDATTFDAYVSGGSITRAQAFLTNSANAYNNDLTWTGVDDAIKYRVYRRDNGLFQLIGETALTSFTDDNATANANRQPPAYRDPFKLEEEYPSSVGFFQQRRVFGGSTALPDTSDFSRIGVFDNFTRRTPVQEDDAITATLSAKQVNQIRHYVSLNDLLVFTSGAEWEIGSGSSDGFSATTITQRAQSYWGTGFRQPITIGNAVLFVTRDGSNVRSFGFSDNLNGYTGNDLNVVSQHLLDGHTIDDWGHTQSPEKQIFMVRNDGDVITLTYDQEQETVGWTRWDTDGLYKSVATLKEGGPNREDSAYFIVERKVNGQTVRYVEVWRQEFFNDVRDCFFVDSGLSYDNPVDITNITSANPAVVTAASHGFSNGDEVDIFDVDWVMEIDDRGNPFGEDPVSTRRFTVANATSNTFELTGLDTSSSNAYLRGGTARKAVSNISGLQHLEGRSIVALCDGNVIRNLTVANGAVTFPRKFSRIHMGLNFIADIETLNIEEEESVTQQGSTHKVNKVVMRFFKSRGLLVGSNSTDLVEVKQRSFEKLGDPTDLITGDEEQYLPSHWNSNGRVFIRQKDPLPMTLLAVIPEYEKGDI